MDHALLGRLPHTGPSLAPASQRAYSSAQTIFTQFCSVIGVPAFPASEQVLILFIADLSQKLTHDTIRSYLSAIRHAHLRRGWQDPLEGKTRLELALKGTKRRCPRGKDTRLPITPPILEEIGQSLVRNASKYDQLLIWAACCIGFFAFMRSGEITVPEGTHFNPEIHLTPKDISVDNVHNPAVLKIRLKSSKTRQGIDLFIGRTCNSLCPVVAMMKYLAVRGTYEGPLFREANGTPLYRRNLVAQVKLALQQAGLNSSHYAGHSF